MAQIIETETDAARRASTSTPSRSTSSRTPCATRATRWTRCCSAPRCRRASASSTTSSRSSPTATGKMVVGQFGLSIPRFLDRFDDTIEEGDVLLTSDPYACDARHQPRQRLAGRDADLRRAAGSSAGRAMFGHMSDVGGKTPSSMPTDAQTIFEEGVVIPPFKLYARACSTRTRCGSSSTRCGSRSGTAPTSTASWRPAAPPAAASQEMCDRFGAETYVSALDALLERNHRRHEDAARAWSSRTASRSSSATTSATTASASGRTS